MSSDALRDELRLLTDFAAPTGFEEPVLRYARDELRRVCDFVETDIRGNVYGWQSVDGPEGRRPEAGPDGLVVMITAHADEIGFQVTSLLPTGFLRFTKLGFPTDSVLPGQRVQVLTKSGPIDGVIGVKPGHILSAEAARVVPPIADLYIDVGAKSADEARRWGIEPGTPAVFFGPLTATREPGRFFGKAVDNRMGVLAVLQTARELQGEPLPCTRCYAIVVEEEVGLRGAEVAAQHVRPQVVLALDTVPSGGTPELRADELPWTIGHGPLLKVRETKGLCTHGPLRELVRGVADQKRIPYQLIVDTAGITDASSAQQAGPDIAAMVIGLARRYSHSAVELFDMHDLEHLIALTTATTRALHSRAQLQRL